MKFLLLDVSRLPFQVGVHLYEFFHPRHFFGEGVYVFLVDSGRFSHKWPRRELNPHDLRRRILSSMWLPLHHSAVEYIDFNFFPHPNKEELETRGLEPRFSSILDRVSPKICLLPPS
jgi:hypothetical protein